MMNTWYMNPEAFQAEYDEYQALLAQLAQEGTMDGDYAGYDEWAEGVDAGLPLPVPDADECMDEDYEHDPFLTDAEADGDALISVGWGTDEDYGYYGDDSW